MSVRLGRYVVARLGRAAKAQEHLRRERVIQQLHIDLRGVRRLLDLVYQKGTITADQYSRFREKVGLYEKVVEEKEEALGGRLRGLSP